ncbi:hypothetical protein MJM28_29820, partial [Salmonella enterica subsp. enterica serovar Montevideo]|nr:hypothetical protein [Salmonella enterica subsp. enterica serovar Montevideo]
AGAAFKAQAPNTFSAEKLDETLYHGAVLRVRPKAMTVAVIIAIKITPLSTRLGAPATTGIQVSDNAWRNAIIRK